MQDPSAAPETSKATTLDFRYFGVWHQDDHVAMKACHDVVAGRMLAQWWDKSQSAGPNTRPQAPFSHELPTLDVLALAGSEVQKLNSK